MLPANWSSGRARSEPRVVGSESASYSRAEQRLYFSTATRPACMTIGTLWRFEKGWCTVARNFKELQAKMSPEARARSEALARRDIEHTAPDELAPQAEAETGEAGHNNDPQSGKQTPK